VSAAPWRNGLDFWNEQSFQNGLGNYVAILACGLGGIKPA
jgi:hypothetical protein